ncbi:hypothetical protein [Pseudoxanthomonas mexicana]|uniref:hypothetical protein n=1 Tax=Pseudoxanthomonas mexicana TaxID=128785 RepID=UPI00398B05C9
MAEARPRAGMSQPRFDGIVGRHGGYCDVRAVHADCPQAVATKSITKIAIKR